MSTPFLTPGASPLRQAVERRSALVVIFLRGLPRPVPALLILGVAAIGVAGAGWASAIALVIAALVLGWLCYLSWPRLPMVGRLVRLAVVVALVGLGVVRVVS